MPSQPQKREVKHPGYSPTALHNAYLLVMDTGIPIKRAARQYGVPHSTLRDRVKGRIDPDTVKPGPDPLFSQEQESKLVEHIKHMAGLGYGYTMSEIVDKASDFAVHLRKRTVDKPLSTKWLKGFIQRWPELQVIKTRALTNYRAAATFQDAVHEYFVNLRAVLEANSLMEKPECIYNIGEKGIETEHVPPSVVSGKARIPAITSSRSSVTTVIGCGNALGTHIPPFFVFKGQRFSNELLCGCSPGAGAAVSKTGWSNSGIFLQYLESHFIKYVQRGCQSQPLILIFDGHKPHINVPVLEWTKRNNVIVFVLPAHTSHALQPLNVGCFDPLQKIYNASCHKFLRENPGSKVTRFNIAALASSAYVKALSSANLTASFQKTGIYPFDESCINPDYFVPAATHSDDHVDIYFEAAEEVIEKKKEFNQSVSSKTTISKLVSGKEMTNPEIDEEIRNRTVSVAAEKAQSSRKRKSDGTLASENSKSDNPCNTDPLPGPSHINIQSGTDTCL